MADIKPILIGAVLFLAVVLMWQVATITGFQVTRPSNVTIGATAPTVTTPVCGASITLSACANTTQFCSALVTDLEGHEDVTGVNATFYKDATTVGDGSEIADERYTVACAKGAATNLTTYNYTCSFTTIRYFADTTDTWSARIAATDAGALTGSTTSTDCTTINNLTALDVVETNINFGTQTAGTNTTTFVAEKNKNCGSKYMSVNVKGVDMTCTTGTIPVAWLKYDLTNATAWGSATSLTTGDVNSSLVVIRSQDDLGTNGSTYWAIGIPLTGVKGACNGTITFTAV